MPWYASEITPSTMSASPANVAIFIANSFCRHERLGLVPNQAVWKYASLMVAHRAFLIFRFIAVRFEELIYLYFCGFLDESVALLQQANELLALARNHFEIILR